MYTFINKRSGSLFNQWKPVLSLFPFLRISINSIYYRPWVNFWTRVRSWPLHRTLTGHGRPESDGAWCGGGLLGMDGGCPSIKHAAAYRAIRCVVPQPVCHGLSSPQSQAQLWSSSGSETQPVSSRPAPPPAPETSPQGTPPLHWGCTERKSVII